MPKPLADYVRQRHKESREASLPPHRNRLRSGAPRTTGSAFDGRGACHSRAEACRLPCVLPTQPNCSSRAEPIARGRKAPARAQAEQIAGREGKKKTQPSALELKSGLEADCRAEELRRLVGGPATKCSRRDRRSVGDPAWP